jgi:hypothetical protein
MTNQELQQAIAQLVQEQRETARQIKELGKQIDVEQREASRQIKELGKQIDVEQREASRQIKELGKQIGGIHDKFGKFAEGMMLPSLKRIVKKKFGTEIIDFNVERVIGERHIELDVRAIANGMRNILVVIEVKNNLNQQELQKMQAKMQHVREFFPEYADKKLYGVIAALHCAKSMEEKTLKAGFYLARMSEKSFTMNVPMEFVPKEF